MSEVADCPLLIASALLFALLALTVRGENFVGALSSAHVVTGPRVLIVGVSNDYHATMFEYVRLFVGARPATNTHITLLRSEALNVHRGFDTDRYLDEEGWLWIPVKRDGVKGVQWIEIVMEGRTEPLLAKMRTCDLPAVPDPREIVALRAHVGAIP